MNKNLLQLINSDCKSYCPGLNKISFFTRLKTYLLNPGFKISYNLRKCNYLSKKRSLKFLYFLRRLKYRKLQIKYGIVIGHQIEIGEGLNIEHWGGIVVAGKAKIGKNLHIRQNTTIGQSKGQYPTIGDNVYIGSEVTIIGGISIGNNCVIGAGSLVNKSFPDNSIIAGVPAQIIGVVDKNIEDIF